jgi:hypothetical protein
MAGELNLGGLDPGDVYKKLQEKGVGPHEAGEIVGKWILQNVGMTERTFNYQTAFPETDANCKQQFKRQFVHLDWIDGESVVQAGQTTTEEGFNDRLHKIEADLDALARDTATALTCMADMRKSMAALLDEIRTAINLTNSDVYQCCAGARTVTVGPPPGYVAGTAYGPPDYLGTTKFMDQAVSVWRTSQGIAMMPAVSTVNIGVGSTQGVQKTADLATFIAGRPDVAASFGAAGMTKEQFVQKFGGLTTDAGRTVKELVASLPDGSHYANADALLNAVAAGEAAAIRTSGGGDALVAGSFEGLGAGVAKVADAPLDRYQGLPASTKTALIAAGVDTVGKLGALSPQQLQQVLAKQGVTASATEAAGWTATAKTLGLVR